MLCAKSRSLGNYPLTTICELRKRSIIPTRKGDQRLSVRDIVRCEADRAYTWFHLNDGTRLLSSYPMSTYEEFLCERDMLRVHRSHIVNLTHISRQDGSGSLVMVDGSVIRILIRPSCVEASSGIAYGVFLEEADDAVLVALKAA